MTKDEKEVKRWGEEIEQGLEFRKLHGLEASWAGLEAKFYNVTSIGSGPNILASIGDSFLSSMSTPLPAILVKPRRLESVESAPLVEQVDKWLLDELDVQTEFNRASLHAYLWGVGFIKIGYDSEYGYSERYKLGNLGGTLTQFDKKGKLIESGGARSGMPWVSAPLPHDIVFPWGTIRSKDAPWFAHRIFRKLSDLRSDKKYKNTQDVKGTISARDFVNSYKKVRKSFSGVTTSSSAATDKTDCVELWEIHDKMTKKIKVIASGYQKHFLRDEEDVLQIEGLPIIDIAFVPRARSIWVTPDTFYLRQAQRELDDIYVQAEKQRRVSVLKLLVKKNVMAPEEAEKLVSRDVGVIAWINDSECGEDIKDAVHAIGANSNINTLLHMEEEHIRRNAREMVGISRNQAGEFETKGRRTATETREVSRSSQNRLGRRQNVIRRSYVDLFKKINQIVFKFWTTARIVEVVGKKGANRWRAVKGNELAGEYGYEVKFSQEALETPQTRKQLALGLYGQLSQDPSVDQRELRKLLSDAFGVDIERLFGGKEGANIRVPMSKVSGAGGAVPTQTPTPGGVGL